MKPEGGGRLTGQRPRGGTVESRDGLPKSKSWVRSRGKDDRPAEAAPKSTMKRADTAITNQRQTPATVQCKANAGSVGRALDQSRRNSVGK